MLAVSSAFPLTSQQPPVAVVSAAALDALSSARERSELRIVSDRASPRPDYGTVGLETAQPGAKIRNPFAVAGPPPSFEANILEIERQFEAILARIELARSQREMREVNGEASALDMAEAAEVYSGTSGDLGQVERQVGARIAGRAQEATARLTDEAEPEASDGGMSRAALRPERSADLDET